jgi:hypothetical protein
VCYSVSFYRLCIREKNVSTWALCVSLAIRNGPLSGCGMLVLSISHGTVTKKSVNFFHFFYVFLEMTKIAKTFGIIRNTF